MVIKLKKFSKSQVVKAVVFILTVIGITGIMVLFSNPSFSNNNQLIYNEINNIITKSLNNEEMDGSRYKYNFSITDNKRTSIMGNATQDYIMKCDNVYKVNNDRLYSYEDGKWVNIDDFRTTYDEYDGNTYDGNTFDENSDSTYQSDGNYNYSLLVTFKDEYMLEKRKEWENERQMLIPYAIALEVLLLISILAIVYLFCVARRKYEDKELYLKRVDKIYSDIQLIVLMMSGVIWFFAISRLFWDGVANYYLLYLIFIGLVIALVTALETFLCGIILLSLVRKITGKLFFRHSLLFAILYKISDFIKSFFDDRRYEHYPLTKSLIRRQTIFIVASAGFVFITIIFILMGSPLLILPPIIEIVMIYWFYKENKKTYEEINKGFQDGLEEQLKSERMKVDLVTNVSHDLKTPLTSIISYVDLLLKEELSETSRDYVNILKDKSNRLKNIVSDLFDLAKSTSGNMPVDMDDIDINKLVEQTLADMEDQITSSGLQFKTRLAESPIHIYSDGKKLYRVFQNIIDNTLKYSLAGSRVYIDMEERQGKVDVIIRNTSASEINFTAEEILQRFNRGDTSRTTEGSGLGLSIAESFTHVCGGKFKLDIDGDLFKVTIAFDVISK